MTRPFAPRDALRVRHQQATGAWLELEAAVLLGQSPLRQSVGGYWPLFGRQRTVHTLVLDAPDGVAAATGFLQARRRVDPAAADLTFVAPALHVASGAALCWQRLIPETCRWLGSHGVERLYVTLSEDDHVALQLFQQAGFAVITTDLVLQCQPEEPAIPTELASFPLQPMHEPAIHELVTAAMPDTARSHDGRQASDWATYPLGGHAPQGLARRVCLDGHGAVLGAWRVVAGRRGHWLRLVASRQADLGQLVGAALASMAQERWTPLPVFATARGYEPELNLALRDHGFQPLVGRFRLVKHNAVRVIEPAWQRRRARERAIEAAGSQPTFSQPLAAARSAMRRNSSSAKGHDSRRRRGQSQSLKQPRHPGDGLDHPTHP